MFVKEKYKDVFQKYSAKNQGEAPPRPQTQFGAGILIKGAMSKGGVHWFQIFGHEKYNDFSKHIRPKRSLNACLGHSKITGLES